MAEVIEFPYTPPSCFTCDNNADCKRFDEITYYDANTSDKEIDQKATATACDCINYGRRK